MIRAFTDTLHLTARLSRHTLRNVDALINTIVLPIMLMLMFVFVFGGAIETGEKNYIIYVVPGILLLSIGYCAASTAVGVANDMQKGIIDRFRTMPIARGAILSGHVMASLLRNIVASAVVLLVAFALGFRTGASSINWLCIIGLLMLYALSMTWLSVTFGLLASSPEGASGFTFFILFLPYLSSAFVPTATMPRALRTFSEYQPITPINETIRALFASAPAGHYPIIACVWCIGITAAFYFISLRLFNIKTR